MGGTEYSSPPKIPDCGPRKKLFQATVPPWPTLRGRVLPVGGLKEKLLAAKRHGIREAIIPRDNEKDMPDVPENVRADMKLHLVSSMDEVLMIALEREIEALPIPAPSVEPQVKPAEEQLH